MQTVAASPGDEAKAFVTRIYNSGILKIVSIKTLGPRVSTDTSRFFPFLSSRIRYKQDTMPLAKLA